MLHTTAYSGFVPHRRTRALFGNWTFDKPKKGVNSETNWRGYIRRSARLWAGGIRSKRLDRVADAFESLRQDFEQISLGKVKEHIQATGLSVSTRALNEFSDALDRPMTANDFRDHCALLRKTIRLELASIEVYSVDKGRTQFLLANEFDTQIGEHFKTALGDIREVGKCFAYERNTACVFHLMRIMEAGLRAIGTHSGTPSARPETRCEP